MPEFFIRAESFAAPFVSDPSTRFVEADTPEEALEKFAGSYRHPAGLYAADAFESADAYHKGAGPLARWLCNHEQAKQKATRGKGAYTYLSHGPGSFVIDGDSVMVQDPKGGSVVDLPLARSVVSQGCDCLMGDHGPRIVGKNCIVHRSADKAREDS